MKIKKILVLITSFLCFNLAMINTVIYGYNDIASQSDYYVNNFTVNEISYAYTLENPLTTATVANLNSKSSVVTIPSTVENDGKTYTVKYLNFSPMENGVPLCLNTCEILNIPDTMVCWSDKLGGEDGAWFKWKKLKEVNISENSQLVELSSGFADCKYLKSFTIPKNLKILDGLTNCPKLKGKKLNNYFGNGKSIKVPNNIKAIKNQAFKNKTLIRKITLPKGLKTVEYWAFRDCKNLSNVIIKNTKKSPAIAKNSFKNTKKGIKFVVKNKKVAKSLKKKLKGTGVKNAKILIGKKVAYQNING